jgi:hypothetical protein
MDCDLYDTRASRWRVCEWYDCNGILDWSYCWSSSARVRDAQDWGEDCYNCMSSTIPPFFGPSPKANEM